VSRHIGFWLKLLSPDDLPLFPSQYMWHQSKTQRSCQVEIMSTAQRKDIKKPILVYTVLYRPATDFITRSWVFYTICQSEDNHDGPKPRHQAAYHYKSFSVLCSPSKRIQPNLTEQICMSWTKVEGLCELSEHMQCASNLLHALHTDYTQISSTSTAPFPGKISRFKRPRIP